MFWESYLEWHTKQTIPSSSLKNFFNKIRIMAKVFPLPGGADIIKLSRFWSIYKSCYWKSKGYLISNFLNPS